MAILGICIASYIRHRTGMRGIAGVFKTFGALLVITLASEFMNRSSIISAINFSLLYLFFPLVFYVAYTYLDRRHWRWLFVIMISLMLIQFVLNIGWRLGVNPLPNEWKGTGNFADIAMGTFAGSPSVAYFMIAIIFLLLSALRQNIKHKPWILMLIGVAVLQWYMTYTNHSYIFFVLMLPFYMFISKSSMRLCLYIGVVVALVAGIFMLISSMDTYRSMSIGAQSQLAANFEWTNLEQRWERFTTGPKIELINRIAIQNVTKDPYLWLLGNGPGNGLSAIGMSKGSDFAWEYLGGYVNDTSRFRTTGMTSIAGSYYSGILSVWSELGVLGYVLYMALYIQLLIHVGLRLRRNQYMDSVQRVIAEGFVMATLLFLMVSLLWDIFYLKYFAGGLFIWAAMVWDPVEPEDEKTDNGEQRTDDRGLSTPIPIVNGWRRPAVPGR
jgi:hypothetical protein